MNYEIIGYLLAQAIFGGIGALIGRKRKIGTGWGFVLGFFLGFIGWIITACSKKNDPEFTDMTRKEEK